MSMPTDLDDFETAWLELNAWVNWLRRAYLLPPSIVPPLWHRLPGVAAVLAELHGRWAEVEQASPTDVPPAWPDALAEPLVRLRAAVAECPDEAFECREADFVEFLVDEIWRRRAAEVVADAEPDATCREASASPRRPSHGATRWH